MTSSARARFFPLPLKQSTISIHPQAIHRKNFPNSSKVLFHFTDSKKQQQQQQQQIPRSLIHIRESIDQIMTEWTKKQYNAYYNAYMPWIEDKYLAWFGENKTSYTAKGVCVRNPLPKTLSFPRSFPPAPFLSLPPPPSPDREKKKAQLTPFPPRELGRTQRI